MVIPTLVENVQKQQYVAQLKKFYTTMDNGFGQMLADEGVENLDDTSVFGSIVGDYFNLYYPTSTDPFLNGLHKYFKFTLINTPSDYVIKDLGEDSDNTFNNNFVMVLSDGAVISDVSFDKNASSSYISAAAIKAAGGHMFNEQGEIVVDLNGFKKPNRMGIDVFEFILSGDGKLYPYHGKDYSIFYRGDLNATWQNLGLCGSSNNSTNVSGSDGSGCAARIMEDGWQMNY